MSQDWDDHLDNIDSYYCAFQVSLGVEARLQKGSEFILTKDDLLKFRVYFGYESLA